MTTLFAAGQMGLFFILLCRKYNVLSFLPSILHLLP